MFHQGFSIALDIRSFNLYAHMGHGSWVMGLGYGT